MGRPGNAGSFTAADHLAVLNASFAQIPARWRRDVLVSIDGGRLARGHRLSDRAEHRARARGAAAGRVEYSIGWPVDERTLAGIEQLHDRDWASR